MGIFEVRSRSSQWRNPFRTLLNCSKSEQSNWKKDQVVLIKSTENDEGGNSYRYITSTIEEVEYREQNNNYIYLFNGQLKPLFSDIRYCMNCVVECVVCKKDFKKEIDNIKLNVKLKQPNADEDTWKNRLKLNLKNTPIIPGETKYLDEDKDVEAIWMDTPADITENKIYLITASTNIDFVPMDRIDEELKNSAEKIFGEITSRVSTEQGMYLNSIINQIKDEEIKAVLAEAVLEPKILDQLLDYIIYPFFYPNVYKKLQWEPTRGILFYGPSGTGKSFVGLLLKKLIIQKYSKSGRIEQENHFIHVQCADVLGKYVGESEKNLRDAFEKAKKNAPAIIFFDEIEVIGEKREDAQQQWQYNLTAAFLQEFDSLVGIENVFVIGTTNNINMVDISLRRAGRFELEIKFTIPDQTMRQVFIEKFLRTKQDQIEEGVNDPDNLNTIISRTQGFTNADMNRLFREIGLTAIQGKKGLRDQLIKDENAPVELPKITMADFITVLNKIKPSSLKEYYFEKPTVKFSDIVGLEKQIQLIRENVIYPYSQGKPKEIYEQLNLQKTKGILLYGPPGTGKTMIAKAICGELGFSFINVKMSDYLSKWYGETQRNIHKIFVLAKETAPTIIFFDEIDAISTTRDSTDSPHALHQVLIEMDGLESLGNVLVIGATNRPQLIDPALLRPGRFDYKIEVPLLDEDGRMNLFKKVIEEQGKLAWDPKLTARDYKTMAHLSEGFNAAEIVQVWIDAIHVALRQKNWQEIPKMKLNFILDAITNVRDLHRIRGDSSTSRYIS